MAKQDLVDDLAEIAALLETATRPAVVDALQTLRRTQQAALRVAEAEERAAAEALEKQQAWAAEASQQLQQLEDAKAKAAADEDYEACARLRDEIAEMKAKLENPGEAAAAAAQVPVPPTRPVVRGVEWQPMDKFAWDQGEYNTPWVSVYVTLPGVGSVKDSVTCDFTADSFDLKVSFRAPRFRAPRAQLLHAARLCCSAALLHYVRGALGGGAERHELQAAQVAA